MGQRLNVEIHKNGEVLANSYYHWGAYTSSALNLTNMILRQVESENNQEENEILYAISLLESTGAHLTDDELAFAQKIEPNRSFKLATSRNDGLIAISEKGIEDTRRWEEGRVEIDILTRTVKFDVLHMYSKEDYMDIYATDEEEYNQLPVFPSSFSYDFNSIPFGKFDFFALIIKQFIKNGNYTVRYNDDVLCFIE